MSIEMAEGGVSRRRPLRSAGAVLLGLVAIFVLSLGTDQLLHVLEIYPPWGQPMFDPALNLLALSYRVVYDTFGCYLAARFAPHSPMRHSFILGGIGFVLSVAGAAAMWNAGPHWYPIALALSAWPCAWLGGALYERKHS